MQRSPALYLAKIQEMADYLLSRTATRTQEDYLHDLDFQLAAERAFIVIAEAMSLLRTHFPIIAEALEHQNAIIGFRNILVHRYWEVDNREVWSILSTDIQPLKAAVDALLATQP
jgi:uncharacterized protein with HEPN domain